MHLRDFNDVHVFVEVARAGSFTAAARSLGLSKAGVSRRVSRLEEALGARLLHRSTRKLSLTDSGRRYLTRAEALFEGIKQAEDEITAAQTEPTGTLRLAAPAEHNITSALATQFLLAHPRVQMAVEFTGRVVNPIEEGFDAVISVGQPSSLSVVARKLLDSQFHLVAAPDYLAQRGTPSRLEALTTHDVLGFGPPQPVLHWDLGPEGDQRLTLTPRAMFSNLSAVRTAALAGLGIAHLPWLSCAAHLSSGDLVEVLPGMAGPPVSIWLEYPDGRSIPGAARAFIDFTRAHFASVSEADLD